MAGLRPLINGIVIVLLFSLAIFVFMFNTLLVNNPSSPVLTNPAVNSTINSLNSSISSFENAASNAQTSLATDKPTASTYLFLIMKSAFFVPMIFLNVITSGIGLFTGFIFTNLLGAGGSPFFLAFAVFNGIMIVAAVFLIISYIRTGQGER